MKKSTGIFLLLTFFALAMVLVAVVITVLIYMVQGSTPAIFSSSQVALVRVEGLIYDAEDWIKQVEKYAEDDSIPAIVLRVDSPGGAVGPSQDLHDAVVEAREKYGKVVVASFGSVAASGGYYVACGANEIISAQGTMTGSIGVYAKFLLAKDLMEKIGVNYETIKAGEYKDFGSMERGLTDKERMMMQHVINDTYHQFIDAVVDGRKYALSELMNNWQPDTDTPEYPFSPEVRRMIREYQAQRDLLKQQEQEEMREELASERASEIAEATLEEPLGSGVGDEIAAATDDTDEETTDTGEDSGEEEDEETDDKLDSLKVYRPSHDVIFKLAQELSEGKVYTGRQAYEVGLVDGLGSLEDAINRAAALSGIKGRVTVIEQRKRETTFLDLLSEKLSILTETRQNYSPLEFRYPYR